MTNILYYAYDGDTDKADDIEELDELATALLSHDFVDWAEIAISTENHGVRVNADRLINVNETSWDWTHVYHLNRLPKDWPIERIIKLIPLGCCVYYHGIAANLDKDNVSNEENNDDD